MHRHRALVAGALFAVSLSSPTPAAATASQNSVCIAQFLSDKELAGNVGHSLGGRGSGLAPTIGGVGQILGGQGNGLAATNCGARSGRP